MKRSRFTEEQIIGVLKDQIGSSAADRCRKHGINFDPTNTDIEAHAQAVHRGG
jgi:hypothetical protein